MSENKPEQPICGGRYYRLKPGGKLLTEAEYNLHLKGSKPPPNTWKQRSLNHGSNCHI